MFEVQDRLLDALDVDADDGLTFQVSAPRASPRTRPATLAGRSPSRSVLGGKVFASLRLDVVARSDEIAGAVGTIEVRPPILAERLSSTAMPAVDVAQHAAEKFHAMARMYAGGRPAAGSRTWSTCVLLAEAELLPHPDLAGRLETVWQVRDGVPPPAQLHEFPSGLARRVRRDGRRARPGHRLPDRPLHRRTLFAEALATEENQQ